VRRTRRKRRRRRRTAWQRRGETNKDFNGSRYAYTHSNQIYATYYPT
jgi:hypothetical protein